MCGGENRLLIDLVLSVKKVSKSSAVIEGGRGWRGTEERIKCSEEIAHVWSAVDLVVEMYEFGSVDFSRERCELRLILTQVGSFDLRHFLSAALSLVRCSRRTSNKLVA